MAGTTGLEPATSAVTGQRSNQLNYVPTKTYKCVYSRCVSFYLRLRATIFDQFGSLDQIGFVRDGCLGADSPARRVADRTAPAVVQVKPLVPEIVSPVLALGCHPTPDSTQRAYQSSGGSTTLILTTFPSSRSSKTRQNLPWCFFVVRTVIA